MELNESQKIRVEHLYKNMSSLIAEMRFMDKSSIYTSGALWAWILSNNKVLEVSYVVILYFVPILLSYLFYSKADMLAKEYYEQKGYYRDIMKIEKEDKNMSPKPINRNFHFKIIAGNILLALIFYYFNSNIPFSKIINLS